MKITITLLAMLCAASALASEPRYAFEIARASAPWRGATVSKEACEALVRDHALEEARYASIGEPMKARCTPVND